jgi:ssDNA-binding Zn-finger/Zn-ribbon topoisomerase 1
LRPGANACDCGASYCAHGSSLIYHCLMRWYHYQHRKPKRWARRAKADGSAVPKLKRVNTKHMSWLLRNQGWISVVFVLTGIGAWLAMQVYLHVAQHWLHLIYPPLFTVNFAFTLVVSALVMSGSANFLVAVLMFVNYQVKRRYATIAIAHRCHLCPRCGYSSQMRTDDNQPCPECGQQISRREAIRLWARFCRR